MDAKQKAMKVLRDCLIAACRNAAAHDADPRTIAEAMVQTGKLVLIELGIATDPDDRRCGNCRVFDHQASRCGKDNSPVTLDDYCPEWRSK